MPFLKHAHGRYVPPAQPITTPNEFPACGRVTIGELSDDCLLNIFRYYLDVSPRRWPRLVHMCRRWRRIVLTSQRALHLQMFCTHGAPVLKTLDCWPAQPIVIKYGGSLELDPPAPEEDNILAALKQSDRVSSITLTITNTLLEKLSAIERPFSELEDLVLLSRDTLLTLPSTFRWGPHLRSLHSTKVTSPALLQLHQVLYISPEALTNPLSGRAHLRSLSLHFPPTDHYLSPPSGERIVLPVHTRLNFRGTTEYLECLVARIDAPRLGNIEITFFKKLIFDVSKLGKFIDRIEMQKLYQRAHMLSSGRDITISLIQPGTPTRLKLQVFCEPLSEQLSSMARICNHFSALLFNVEDLRVSATRHQDISYFGQWLEPIRSFTGVKWIHLDGNLSVNVVRGLQLLERGSETVLPSLHTLHIAQPGPRHAPLREAVVSFMISRRLSCRPIAVEYERLCHISELRGTEPFSQQVTIEILCDDVLLNIFRHYLDAAPRTWPTLTHVCQGWRQIVHTSPLGLNLRLYFTPGTPVLKALDCWPALRLPIIVNYGRVPNLDPPAPEDDDNIIAALKQSGRVRSINLTVTSSLLNKLSAISEPFLELEGLALLSGDNTQLTLPSTFRWGPRLRTLHSTGVAFPSFPQLLSQSHDLVDIQLHEISIGAYFSPEAFANALSGMTNLRTLSLTIPLRFHVLPRRQNYYLGERVVLPALALVKYRGTSKYLDGLVARIDALGLGDIDITLISQLTMEASELGRFIERTEMRTSLIKAEVQTSIYAISVSFTSSDTSARLRLQIPCSQLDRQLSSMAQVCNRFSFSPFLVRIEALGIDSTQSPSGQDDVDGEQWVDLVRSFSGARDFRVTGVHATYILCALRRAGGGEHATNLTVLTAVRNLRVQGAVALDKPLIDAARLFTTLRRRSGRPVKLELSCSVCDNSFRSLPSLRGHLLDQHAYRLVCSYCRDFECTPEHPHQFREHLKYEHPEVDSLIRGPCSRNLEPVILVYRHSSLRAPESHLPW
ncbi:hypothetical protein EDB84DRAFT_662750 [Lactarius hengduanensis]|nr:hypothetical protein EDB84DRAFT_662750 [Lactarius hengduanensis]